MKNILLIFLITACQMSTEPVPMGAEAFNPASPSFWSDHSYSALADSFPVWWDEVEQCSGKTRPLTEISWYYVPLVISYRTSDGRTVEGSYLPHWAIVLAQGGMTDARLVRHEMLHAIRHDTGTGHDSTDFLSRCASLVYPN